ncbi:DUF7927 domain-containing protein [Xylanimonas ulmi]
MAASLVVAFGWGAAPARADVIDDAIKTVTVTPANPKPGQSLRLDLTWAVPDSATAGDTFTLALPGELVRITTAFDLPAVDEHGDPVRDANGAPVVAARAVVEDGLVTFTLTQYADERQNVRGTAFFEVRLSYDAQPGSTVVVEYGLESTIEIEVGSSGGSVEKIDRTKPYKGGTWRDPGSGITGAEGDYLQYYVSSPGGPLQTVTVVDTLGPGQEFICPGDDTAPKVTMPRVLFYAFDPATGMVPTGTAPETPEQVGSAVTIACGAEAGAQQMTFTVSPVPSGRYAQFVYWVRVTDKTLTSYSNAASVRTSTTQEGVTTTIVRKDAGGTGLGDQFPSAAVTVDKTADPASGTTVGPGQVVTYRLAFDHSGTGEAQVDFTDRLGAVLDDADFVGIIDDGGLSVERLADSLHITGVLSADTQVAYTVRVKPVGDGAGDHLLRNVVVAGDEPDGPGTEHPVRYLYVAKVGDDGAALAGAQFVLRADEAHAPGAVLTDPTLVAVEGETGLFVTGAIEPGAYWLEEVAAPDGFDLLAAPVRFEVAEDGGVTLTDPAASTQIAVSDSGDGMGLITVTDRRTLTLPLTGGPGDLAFWLCGGAVLALVAAGLIAGRRTAGGGSRRAQAADR